MNTLLRTATRVTPRVASPVSRRFMGTPSRVGKILKYSWHATWISSFAALGVVGYLGYREAHPYPQVPQSELKASGNKKKTLVLLGSGWGVITTLKHLDTSLYNVIVISPRNYFLFTPLLPSVPTGTVDVRSIMDPVRTVAKQRPGEVVYLEAEATDIDPEKNIVSIKHKSNSVNFGEAVINEREPIVNEVHYDYLVVGIGATTSTFGIPGIPENASYLKEASDAIAIRQKIFNSMEAAQLLPKDSPERKRLLSVVVCGGGPTGVELAAEVKDYIDQDLAKWLPGIEKEMSVTLIEAMPNILNAFNKKLIDYTKDVFRKQELDLRTSTMVKRVDDKQVYCSAKDQHGATQELIFPYGTLVWAGGNAPRDLTKQLFTKIEEQKTARRGLLIDEHLKVDGTSNMFALGDCTFTKNPPTAQVAHQEGIFLASHFERLSKIEDTEFLISSESNKDNLGKLHRRLARLQENMQPFRYVNQGALAYVGSERAVADLAWGDWSTVATGGSLTFFFWRTAYVSMMLSIRNKVLVCTDWIKIAVFGRDCSKE